MGIRFEGWQDGIGRIALGKRADGKYAATIGGVVLSIPRQVGKTFLVGALMMALCILFPGYTVLWTAHRTRTCTRTFQSLQRMAKRKKVAPYIRHVRMANGEQEIAFRNGSTILFGAREQGFGRGFDEVDAEIFDEAQILTDKALEDMVASTNQSRHPHGALLFFMGTPPRPVDPGEAFTYKRAQALSGKSQDIAFVEMSADEDAEPDDREQWAKANPSFPELTPLESMLRLRENLPAVDSWLREGLGIWGTVVSDRPIDPDAWRALEDPLSTAKTVGAYGLEVSLDRAFSALGVAGPRGDGRVHVELLPVVRGGSEFVGRGTGWVVARCVEVDRADPGVWAVDGQGEAAGLVPDLEKAGLKVLVMSTADVAAASSGLAEAVKDKTVSPHGPRPELVAAVDAAKKKPLNDGKFVLSRRVSTGDITGLLAVRNAHWATDLGYNVLDSAY